MGNIVYLINHRHCKDGLCSANARLAEVVMCTRNDNDRIIRRVIAWRTAF